MAYRRPGVTVTQDFANLVPALAAFNLPSVTVGAAYQLVSGDSLGDYAAADIVFGYPSLLPGAVVDTALADPDEEFPAIKRPVAVLLKQTYAEIVSAQTDGSGNGTGFSDATASQFEDVLAGDYVVIVPSLGLTIVAAQTNGKSYMASGQRNRLEAGTAAQFANVKVGDSVIVTAGTNTTAATYLVTAKIGDILILDGNVNDGVGNSVNVSFSITGDRGVANAGSYKVKTVTDDNTLVLTSPLPDPVEAPISYTVKRNIGTVVLTPLASPGNGFTADETGITLPASLTVDIGANTFPIIAGAAFADYRALRNDLSSNVFEVSTVDDITAKFGANQIDPANPLGYGLSLMLQNTVTPVNGLGLDENAETDETLSFTNAADVLGLVDMYAIAVLSHSPTVHQLFKSHVDGYSQPNQKFERVAIVNSRLQTVAVLQADQTTVTTINSSRIIVNTQIDGAATAVSPTHLNDPTANAFAAVQPGDTVVIQAGTNSIPGNFTVLSKTDANNLVLSGSIISGATATNFQYYIVRRDGLGANGTTFYDRNATFLSNGVGPGHYLNILAGALLGRYLVTAVTSERELEVAQVAGVATLKTALEYQVDRDLSKSEQAALVAGYSSSFADRRMVHVWPDSLQVPQGQSVVSVPGYFAACAIAALTTGLPTQQGFTNLSISGFLGLAHSTGYFTPAQLDTIAGGGTMVLAQDGPQQALYVRHELTTDVSSIKFQEFMVTKNVDYIAKFLRVSFAGFIGRYNIVDTTLDELKQTASACVKFLRDKTQLPRIGGAIRSGTLSSIGQDPDQIDTVLMTFTFGIPIPLNNIDITIEV